MGLKFDLITKQKVNVKDIPEDITWDEKNGILIIHVGMDYSDARFFLEKCITNESISNILGEGYIHLLELIELLDLKNYILDFSHGWGGEYDYSIPVINGKIQRKHIFADDKECIDSHESVYTLLGIKFSDVYY
jgi:hypothetical protein